ncbi:phage portal protein [Acuticoccus sp. I52.16.1]|uniref:phage portal protein n=1 Tax=Acuticoccus sp. I52.16.1 TaxID=2928472 RepID=UPI001FD3FB42|nr:phage portal protein [Acuticoccus sp. I52.16.1]UOM34858.1 phage portal protein [Acuticoccus sp. I52.16.1]
MRWPWRKPETEKRATGYTAHVIQAREAYISGTRGLAELTGTVQSCVSMWEHGLSLADVEGTTFLTTRNLARIGRSLALKGEAVMVVDAEGLLPVSDWDVSTRNGRPRAYRVSIPDVGGATSRTALASEVLHVIIGSDPVNPWFGSAPLKRASLTSDLLHALESALAETYSNAPVGSLIVPFPEAPETDMTAIAREFRGIRGKVMVRESVNVHAAGGPAPQADWRPNDLTPDLQRAMTAESLAAARESVCAVYGVLPAMWGAAAQGPLIREAQRHLAQWVLQPIAAAIAEEATDKLGATVTLDVIRPLQAFDAGGRARAFSTMVQALAQAKEAGLDPQAVEDGLKFIDWA